MELVATSALCRVCVAEGAPIPIFDNIEDADSVFNKLTICVGEIVPDLEGYPRYICEPCNMVLDATFNFINNYKESRQVFDNVLKKYYPYNSCKIEIEYEMMNDAPVPQPETNLELEGEMMNDAPVPQPETEPEDKLINDAPVAQPQDLIIKEETKDLDVLEMVVLNKPCPKTLKNKLKKTKVSSNNTPKTSSHVKPVEEILEKLKNNKLLSIKKTIAKTTKRKADTKQQKYEEMKMKNGRKDRKKTRKSNYKDTKKNNQTKTKSQNETVNTETTQSGFESDTPGLENDSRVDTDDSDDFLWPLSKSDNLKFNATEIDLKSKTDTSSLKRPHLICEFCGDAFEYHDRLLEHKNSKHSEPVKCPVCSKMTANSAAYKRHMKRSHGEKKYFCTVCDKGFPRQYMLKVHHKGVHLKYRQVVKKTKCPNCNKIYTSKQSLIIHIRSAHTGERPAVCTICKASFTHEVYLKEHIRIHTGELPYKCPVCGRGHTTPNNMKSHLKNNHKLSHLDENMLKTLRPNIIRLMKP